MISKTITTCIMLFLSLLMFAEPLNVVLLGAVGDGETLNTKSIQQAIDSCHLQGGGTVYFPAGEYLSGTIVLKSHVNLHLESGAVLAGSTNLDDYPVMISKIRSYTDNYTNKSLIYAEKAVDIAITGQGMIHGHGENEIFHSGSYTNYKKRPYLIRLIQCNKILVRDITLKNSAMWASHYLACDNVQIHGITINSVVNGNNDGIDIDACYNVRISNCDIRTGDDSIVLKATIDRPCKNVLVTNCVLSSKQCAFKLGTESNGGFKNIALNNCIIKNTNGSGIALEMVDGGVLEGVVINNVIMDSCGIAIFIRLGNRARPILSEGPGGSEGTWTWNSEEEMVIPGMGSLQDVIISNIQATGIKRYACSITGIPEFPVQNVTLNNIRIEFAGGGSPDLIYREIPEMEKAYPGPSMFGMLPAYGFFCRHVENLNFNNIELGYIKSDARPAIICDDIKGLELYKIKAKVVVRTGQFSTMRREINKLHHDIRATVGSSKHDSWF